jgi:ATP-binding cassette subfamily B multidrug efflux pump
MNEFFEEDDEAIGKVYDRQLAGRLISYLKPYRRLLAITLVLMLIGSLLIIVGPLIVRSAIDDQIRQNRTDRLAFLTLLYFGYLGAAFVFRYAQDAAMAWIGQRVIMDMRLQLFTHLQGMSVSYFDKNPVGRLVTRVTNDIATIEQAVSTGVVTIIANFVMLSTVVVAMLVIDWRLALLMYAFLPPLLWATSYFAAKQRDLFREQRMWLARINASLNETISGVSVVQLFNRERESARRFDAKNKAFLSANLRFVFWYAVFEPTVVLFAAGTTAVILWYGGIRVLDDSLTLGTLVAFTQFMWFFYWPLRELAQRYTTLQQAMASSERVFGILDTPADLVDAEQTQHLGSRIFGKIEFRNVWFAYDGDAASEDSSESPRNWVLKDVSFTVQPGEWVAVVGATGAGKTTILSLLTRFYDVQRGQILVDDIPVDQLPQRELRRHVGLMLQEPFIFTGTIEENIRLRDKSISGEQVRAAAEQIGANTFIERLPEGYGAMLAERGGNLSTGQKQLVALARVAAFNPEIVLVMDEATASIDPETEATIQVGIREVMTERSSIVIAHRLNTIRSVDRIVVLDHGEVVEEGTHEELLALGGQYHRLYELQYRDDVLVAGG